ncbi:MAG: manganese efflux pump [Psychroflexus sp.]
MDTIELILLAIVIASNNLSFSFGLGALNTKTYHLRIVFIFTIVEFTIPLVGLFIGQLVSSFIETYSVIAGGLILVAFGVYTIISAFRTKKERQESLEFITSIKGLFLIALGLSLDNLLVGFSLGLGGIHPLKLAIFIAFFSGLFSFIGLKTGKYVKDIFGKYVQIFAGAVLIALAFINFLGLPF